LVQAVSDSEVEATSYQYIVLEIDDALTGMSRDGLLQILHAEGVLARRYCYPGCHRMEPYASSSPDAAKHLPQTERLVDRVLVLPTGTAIIPADIGIICQLMRFSLAYVPAVNARLQQGLTPPVHSRRGVRDGWRSAGQSWRAPSQRPGDHIQPRALHRPGHQQRSDAGGRL
jgi:dTDP-4-amino-4,6-dideoxygalactose transaminase